MKYTYFLGLLLLPTLAFSQNSKPVVSNVNASATTLGYDITYDLSDAENENCSVTLRASMDGGKTYTIQPVVVTGDVGEGITPGTGKTINWTPSFFAIPGTAERLRFKVIADDGHTVTVDEIAARFDSTRILQNFEQVYGNNSPVDSVHYFQTRDRIFNHYQGLGIQATRDTFFTEVPEEIFPVREGVNIYGTIPGLIREDSTVLVTGHYDTVEDTPGADDNAMSVAVCMEAARVMKDFEFKNSIRFANWDLEEIGLLGAYYYALSPQSIGTKSVINFDGITIYKTEPNTQRVPTGFELLFPEAYNKAEADSFRGNFITMITDVKSARLGQAATTLSEQVTPGLRYIDLTCPDPNCLVATDLRRSDHSPFWDRAIPAIFFTCSTEFRTDCYHTPCDTTIALDFSTQVIKMASALVAEEAGIMHAGTGESQDIVLSVNPAIEKAATLAAPYPNPVRHSAFFPISLHTKATVTLSVYNMAGQLVNEPEPRTFAAGKHTFAWVADRDLPTGKYIAVVDVDGAKKSFSLQIDIDPEAMHLHSASHERH